MAIFSPPATSSRAPAQELGAIRGRYALLTPTVRRVPLAIMMMLLLTGLVVTGLAIATVPVEPPFSRRPAVAVLIGASMLVAIAAAVRRLAPRDAAALTIGATPIVIVTSLAWFFA